MLNIIGVILFLWYASNFYAFINSRICLDIIYLVESLRLLENKIQQRSLKFTYLEASFYSMNI